MEDRDGKKTFTIPKTRASNNDVLISEKADSRNVTELFDDLKSCALETHFDFRQNECKSCETIRNQKLQKIYNERKIQMKKAQDSAERFAFHLIASRDMAINIANDGLQCEQLCFSIDKYLGNPKDGVHLSRRPDVLLTSTGMQGLCKFGLLICKVMVGKGYATMPSINNKQFSAQLHYDHHFCKIQSSSNARYRIDDLLANSFIFCYEHNDLEPVSRPSQILPIAILWYELKEKFSTKLTSTSQESQKNNEKTIKLRKLNKIKPPAKLQSKPMLELSTGTWDDLTPDTKTNADMQLSPAKRMVTNKYPSQLMLPLSSFSNLQQLTNYRDPRLMRTVTSSEVIPLSPQNSTQDKSHIDASSSTIKPSILAKKPFLTIIPLNSTTELTDPRSQIDKSKHKVFYLELGAVKHAMQQQKRLNNYHNSESNTRPKTIYTLIPFLINSILSNECESNKKMLKHSSLTDYSQLCVSVIDCFHFGLILKSNKLYVDLEEHENRLAYEQINISNSLIEQEKRLNSKELNLYVREKRQRKRQEYLDHEKKYYSTNTKRYANIGKKLLKEHQIVESTSNQKLSSELLDFFSYEYQTEQRSSVKRLLAELIGVFVEKYSLDNQQLISNNTVHNVLKCTTIEDNTINDVVDMDLGTPSSQALCDHDERFLFQTPPPPLPPPPPPLPPPPLPSTTTTTTLNESIHNQPTTTVTLIQALTIDKSKILDELNSNTIEHIQSLQIDLSSSVSNNAISNICLKRNDETIDLSSNENNVTYVNPSLTLNDKLTPFVNSNSLMNIDDDSTTSRDAFVKLLTKEVYTSKSPNPSTTFDQHRRSYDNDELSIDRNSLSTRTVTIISNNYQDNLIIETKSMNEENTQDQPPVKRIKIMSLHDLESPVNTIDDHDFRKDLDDRKRQAQKNKQSPRSRSRNSTMKEFKSPSPSPSPSSSSSRTSSVSNRYRRQRHRKEYKYERNHSLDRLFRCHQQNMNNSISTPSQLIHHQRFNYNHQSVSDHPRFSNINTASPSPIKSLMGDSIHLSNCPQPLTDYSRKSPIRNRNRNFDSSYYNEFSSNYQDYPEDYDNNLPKLQPLMSAKPIVNFSTSYNLKPSDPIERLQMYLQNRNMVSYESEQSSIRDYTSLSHEMHSSHNSDHSPWPSEKYFS